MTPSHVGIDLLRLDGGTQPRAELDQFTVDAYAEAMTGGAKFPPVTVFYDGENYWVADGFHRVGALRSRGKTLVEADVRQGTQRDAVLFSVGANATHGKPRTNQDKRRAVETLLRDAEWSTKSEKWMADTAHVSNHLIATVRRDLEISKSSVRHGQDGRLIQTANIGKSREEKRQERRTEFYAEIGRAELDKRERLGVRGAQISAEVRDVVRHTPLVENPDEVRKLAALKPEAQAKVAEKIAAGEASSVQEAKFAVKQEAKRAVAEQIAAEPQPAPGGPFRVIVADPPWRYEKRVDDATHRSVLPYPDMSTEEICALPVVDLAHDDAILWLWTTNAFMRDAFLVLDAWGFKEKTILTWVKSQMSTGDWLRGRSEHCILAVRGRPLVTLTNQTTVIEAPRREHSRKPDEFYALVEELCPGSKVELFARQSRDGWQAWGAETEKFKGVA
jgi:N6-adenosine-specific RNA methylase IME4